MLLFAVQVLDLSQRANRTIKNNTFEHIEHILKIFKQFIKEKTVSGWKERSGIVLSGMHSKQFREKTNGENYKIFDQEYKECMGMELLE